MAKLFLDSTDTSYKVSNGNTEIFGANGDQAITIDGNLTGIVLDANVERVAFTGATTDYTYKQVGTDLEVYNSTGALVTKVGLQDDATGTQLTFANGTVDAKFAPSATGLGLTVGGQTVSATAPTAVTIPAANIDVTTYPITSPTFSVASVAATATEGSNAVFTVTLANPATTATTVQYTLSNVDTTTSADYGTATAAGTNVTDASGVLTFAAGATTATVTLPVSLDSLTETTEGVSLTLSNPTGGAIVNDAGKVATVSFVDAPATTFTLTSTGTGVEVQEGQTITFTVTPSAPVNVATTLVLNVQGKALGAVTSTASAADFEATPAITFAQGDTAAKTITMKVATDTAVEGREAYAVDVIDTTAYATRGNQVTGVITDKLPTLSLSQNVSTVNEGSTVTYTVTSDEAAPTGGITIPFTVAGTSTSGTDYTALTASSVTIPAGSKTGTVTLTTIADTTTEGDETVIVTLGAATNASVSDTAKTVTTTISDTSKALGTAEMTLTGATSVDEGSTVTYTVTLGSNATTALSIPYTLTGTATSGTDFTGSTGTISVAAGAKTGTLTLTTVADTATEGAETVTVTLGTVSGFTSASGQGAVTTTVNDTSVAVAGSTFTLTTGADNIVGTSGNDTINSYVDAAAATDTFTGADVLDGGAGTDTLSVSTDGNGAGAFPGSTISNIEIFKIREVGGTAGTYDFGAFAGETSVVNNKSTDDLTFSNLAAGTTLTVQGDGSTTNGATTFTMAAATNAVVINIDGGVKAGNITRNATGLATVTVNSTGAANTIGILDVDTAALVKDLTINATTDLTGSLAADYAASSTLTVSGSATKVDLSGAALSVNFTKVDASGLTAGGVLVQVDQTDTTVDTQFIGGAGNDTLDVGKVVYNSATLTAVGGNGTDTLKMSDQAALTSVTAAKLTGFEVLSLTDDNDGALDTFDISLLTGVTALKLAADSAADGYTVSNLSATQAGAITISGTQAVTPTFNVTNASVTGNIDTLGITVDDLAAASVAATTITLANITAPGVEKVNLTATDNVTLTLMTGLAALTNFTATGAGNLNITTDALPVNVNTSVDLSASTGTVTFNATAATTNGLSVKGSATKANTLTGSAQADNLTGGSANDTFTGLAGADIMTGNGGADTFAFTTASTGTPSATNFDTITDFSKVAGAATFDTISATNLILGTQTAAAASGVATISAGGVATFNAADNTLALHIAAVAAAQQATAGATTIWQEGADSYLYISDGTLAVAATDVLIKLTGLTAGALTISGNAITAIA